MTLCTSFRIEVEGNDYLLVPTGRSSESLLKEFERNAEALEAYFQSQEHTRNFENFAQHLDMDEWLDANEDLMNLIYRNLKPV